MDYGLIELNTIAMRFSGGNLQKRTAIANIENANANSNRTSSNANRPGPSNSRNGIIVQTEIKTRSSASLTKSISFETPYGVVRQSSSSTIEPERIHSVTSQDSFKREISLYKMQPMPVLTENGNSSDEETKLDASARRKQFSKKGRHKGKKTRCEGNLEENDLEHDEFDDVKLEIEHEVEIKAENAHKRSNKTVFMDNVRKLFSCTGKQDNKSPDADSEKLIQMEEGSRRTER